MLKRLRPHGLDALGLASAMRELLASWQQRASGISFQLDMPAKLPPLDEDVGLVLYRVAQEALTNVVRHSGATHCWLKIEADVGCSGCGSKTTAAAWLRTARLAAAACLVSRKD